MGSNGLPFDAAEDGSVPVGRPSARLVWSTRLEDVGIMAEGNAGNE